MRTRLGVLLGALALAVTACSAEAKTTTTIGPPPLPGSASLPEAGPPPELDGARVAAGANLYAKYCASCHGTDLKGDPEWQVPNADGTYRPPPQDSSGHTWHHGDDLLVDIILNGSEFLQSRMPPFGAQLSEAEVLSILEFFKSMWGPEERALQWEVTLRQRAGF